MNKYYEVTATINGQPEILFGSFNREDCKSEIDAERESWKVSGYKAIKIVSRETEDSPDREVYPELVTAHELWVSQAPCFNFELDETELLEKALETGFVTLTDEENGLYLINPDY